MTDGELIEELHYLGIDEHNARVVAILPLTHVAWVDGTVQDAERERIFEVARSEGMLDPDSVKTIEGWLANAPSEEYQRRGREVLRELARRRGGLGTDITPHKVESIVAYCESVARAAGGVFGVLFTVSAAEKRLIAEIAAHIELPGEADEPSPGWNSLMDIVSTGKPAPPREE